MSAFSRLDKWFGVFLNSGTLRSNEEAETAATYNSKDESQLSAQGLFSVPQWEVGDRSSVCLGSCPLVGVGYRESEPETRAPLGGGWGGPGEKLLCWAQVVTAPREKNDMDCLGMSELQWHNVVTDQMFGFIRKGTIWRVAQISNLIRKMVVSLTEIGFWGSR